MAPIPYGPAWQLRALIARHQYGNTVQRELAVLLRTVYRAMAAEVRDTGLSEWRRDRAESLARLFAARLLEVSNTASRVVQNHAASILTIEREAGVVNAGLIRGSLGFPPRALLINAARIEDVVRSIDIGGYTFADWWSRTSATSAARVKVAIQSGIVRGINSAEIARQIYSTESGVRTVERQHRAFWNASVRTTVAAVQNQATEDTLAVLGPEIVEEVEFHAILDLRVSDLCRSLDSKVYKVTDPKRPKPPLHPNCRSTNVPIVQGVPRLMRDQTYEQWLRSATAIEQDVALGRGRADLWRRGRVTLAELVTSDGRSISLAQLRDRLTGAM